MKKSKFTEGQIVKALKEAQDGKSVTEISREPCINSQRFTTCRKSIPVWMGLNCPPLPHESFLTS